MSRVSVGLMSEGGGEGADVVVCTRASRTHDRLPLSGWSVAVPSCQGKATRAPARITE